MGPAKGILLHLPLIGALCIFGFIALVDAGRLPSLRTESTFGWMLLVWYPLAALLALVQVVLWVRLLVVRGIPLRLSGRSRRAALIGLILVSAALVILIAFRAAQRWGLIE